MTEERRYLGLNEFVEELADALARKPVQRRYASQQQFTLDVGDYIARFVGETLEPLGLQFRLLKAEEIKRSKGGPAPTLAFGQSYTPDLVIEVAQRPTLAVCTELLAEPATADQAIARTLGHLFIQAHQYPAVMGFVYGQGVTLDYGRLLDREVIMDLWRIHKVRLVIR